MTKEQLTKFAQNYQLKTIKDPDKNKFWIIAFLTLIPTFVAMIFSVTAVWIPGICLSCIAILVSIFAEKIGDVEVLNNVGLLFNLSLFFPFALFAFSFKMLGNKTIIFNGIVALIAGMVIGAIYVIKKIKSFQNYVSTENKSTIGSLFENKWIVGAFCGVSAIVTGFVIRQLDRNDVAWLIMVVADVMCVCSIPFFVSCTTQLIVLKKYKLHMLQIKAEKEEEN